MLCTGEQSPCTVPVGNTKKSEVVPWEIWNIEKQGFFCTDLVTESQSHLGLKRVLKRNNTGELLPMCKLGPNSGISKSKRGQSTSSEQRNVAGH